MRALANRRRTRATPPHVRTRTWSGPARSTCRPKQIVTHRLLQRGNAREKALGVGGQLAEGPRVVGFHLPTRGRSLALLRRRRSRRGHICLEVSHEFGVRRRSPQDDKLRPLAPNLVGERSFRCPSHGAVGEPDAPLGRFLGAELFEKLAPNPPVRPLVPHVRRELLLLVPYRLGLGNIAGLRARLIGLFDTVAGMSSLSRLQPRRSSERACQLDASPQARSLLRRRRLLHE